MIHYFAATWIPKNEQIEMKLIRKFGAKPVAFALKIYRFLKRNIKKAIN